MEGALPIPDTHEVHFPYRCPYVAPDCVRPQAFTIIHDEDRLLSTSTEVFLLDHLSNDWPNVLAFSGNRLLNKTLRMSTH